MWVFGNLISANKCPCCGCNTIIETIDQNYCSTATFECGYKEGLYGCMVKNFSNEKINCDCDILNLMYQGCTCGWIQIERAKL